MSDRQTKIKNFLNTIQQIESSGGTNTNHPTMESGIHKGHAAIGRYGLMPNTVNEVLVRMKRKGMLNPELEQLQALDAETMKQTLEQNPEYEEQIASVLADKVLQRQLDDEEKAAYSWNQGHNLSPDKIAEVPYQDSDYVRKFNSIKQLINGEDANEQ